MNRRHRNPEKNLTYAKKWRAENSEYAKRKARERYAADPKKYQDKQRDYYHANRERYLEMNRRSYRKFPVKGLIMSIKTRAASKGIPFDLTIAWARERWTGRCELSGLEFKPALHLGPNPFSPSVDRVDPTKGYIQNNCRFILHALNAAKGSGSDVDLRQIAEAFLSFSPSIKTPGQQCP